MNGRLRRALLLGLLASATAGRGETTLGRLFHTPEQRQEIDRRRLALPATAPRGRQTVSGEIDHAGHRQRWINNRLETSWSPALQDLAVGDSLIDDGARRESLLNGGSVVIMPPREKP